MTREEIINAIFEERTRQLDAPRTEFDSLKTPNDWMSVAAHYLFDGAVRGGGTSSADAFTSNIIKTAAVLIAAAEHVENMKENGHLSS